MPTPLAEKFVLYFGQAVSQNPVFFSPLEFDLEGPRKEEIDRLLELVT